MAKHDTDEIDNLSDMAPSPSPPVKRKTASSQERRKRSRVSYSCSECHRRKQKCDRQQPCGHCVARKVPELCHAYQPGKSEGDLHLRLARVEQLLEIALPHLVASSPPPSHGDSLSHSHHVPPCNRDCSTPSSQDHDQEDGAKEDEVPNIVGNLQGNGRFFGASALGSVNSTPILEQVEQLSPTLPKASTYEIQHLNGVEIPSPDEAAVAAEKLRRLVSECGVPPHKLEEMIRELPPKGFADDLIDYYFAEINFTRYPIFESAFRGSYEALVSKAHRPHALDIVFLPLVYIVLAISAHLAADTVVGDKRQRLMTSQRFYWSARRSMLIASSVGESIDLVIARLLAARYLTFQRRIAESWNVIGTAVRTGMSLGLHRDGIKLGLDPFQTEYRRRVWAYLYHADRAYALVLGRPHSIQDDFCDTLPPSNADDSFLSAQPVVLPKDLPLEQPTKMTFVILRHALSRVIGHIVTHFQQVKPTHYSDVLNLDNELQSFVKGLPPHYSLNPDKSLDETHPFIPIHRFLITSEVFFIRISLHRPYMLRKLDSERFAFSRRACFDSAMSDFTVRDALWRQVPVHVIKRIRGGYRQFQSAMIAGIYLVIEPHGLDAPTMHKILDTFLDNYLSRPDPDETTVRELKIIQLLKNKSLSVAAGGPLHSPPPGKAFPLIAEDSATPSSWPTAPQSPMSRVTPVVERENASETSMELGQPLQCVNNNPYATRMAAAASTEAFAQSATSSPRPPWPRRTTIQPSNQMEASFDGATSHDIPNDSPLDEEESAQRLLNHWVNNAEVDSMGGGRFGIGGIDISNILPSAWGATGSADCDASFGPFSRADALDASDIPSGVISDMTADYNYWEQLVEHIRASGGMT